jgi:hypothetical protein
MHGIAPGMPGMGGLPPAMQAAAPPAMQQHLPPAPAMPMHHAAAAAQLPGGGMMEPGGMPTQEGWIKLRGIPFSVTKADICAFLQAGALAWNRCAQLALFLPGVNNLPGAGGVGLVIPGWRSGVC